MIHNPQASLTKTIILSAFLFMLIFITSSQCNAQKIISSGQAATWFNAGSQGEIGVLYIPEFRVVNPFNIGSGIDVDFAYNFNTNFLNKSNASIYRGWARYSTPHFELRYGLQKVNFGPAKLLRTLMWFDTLDPRDPMQLTKGVYGVLSRYTCQNNSNFWAWSLLGNTDLKGLELYRTMADKMEIGGRCQTPVPGGEFAFSYNQRYIDPNDWNSKNPGIPMTNGLENRYAIDGNWDIGAGLWCEASLSKAQINPGNQYWEKIYTIGSDYTFNIGPGVHLLGEHFVRTKGPNPQQMTTYNILSAAQIDFQLNLLDRFYAISYYDWMAQKFYPYLRLQRSYDNWQINLMAYSMSQNGPGLFQGSGINCLIVYNY